MPAQPTVQLHPQASRTQRSPAASTSSSPSSNSPLAATPFFPALDSLVSPRSPSHSGQSLRRSPSASSPTTPRASSRQQQQQAATPRHGLTGLDAAQFPLYSLASTVPEIRVLTAEEYAVLHEAHSRVKLPETELFPWSHGGADLPYSPAASYFGFEKGKAAPTPSYRGLTTICAPPLPAPTRSSSTRSLLRRGFTSSFSSWSSSSSSNATSASSSRSPSPPAKAIPTCRLVSSFEAHSLLTSDLSSGHALFALPAAETFENVNLRHFRLQAVKYATVSDVVVYGENGIDESVVETASRVREAMDHEFERRGGLGIRYNVYIIADPFTAFEQAHPELVAIDSHGFARNKLDFFNREREEMRVLTEKSEIGENVWLGNTQDVPQSMSRGRPISSDSTSSLYEDGNPYSFSICIEAHDGAALVDASLLGTADQALGLLEQQGHAFEEVHHLLSPDNEVVEAKTCILRPPVDDIVHLESVSTASAIGRSSQVQAAFIAQLVDLAVWIRDQASPNPLSHGERLPRRVLLHCGDGYTETSLLALAYVMVSRRLSAPEAYLFLQLDAERSFFVYPTDRELVLKIEQRVKVVLEREDDEERQMRRWVAEQRAIATLGPVVAPVEEVKPEGVSELAEFGVVGAASSCGMERSDSGFVDSTEDPTAGQLKSSPAFVAEVGRIEKELELQLGQKREMQLADPDRDAWFFGPTFEGHFPSRILPHLYLGNVNHAQNALMLKALGITHVVSMGETALHPPKAPSGFAAFTSAFRSSPSTPDSSAPTNSLWLEERLGNISVLDMKNVNDDGIDSIRPCIDEALAFIIKAREAGGKVLVHCKVGVSRSASIVIAYLQQELGLDLASAYLVVRSRRLNILIQPNLPFFGALHAFEGELLERVEHNARNSHSRNSSTGSDASVYPDLTRDTVDTLGHPGLKRSNRLEWSFLCAQIAHLNERFLC
ncbi:tyrosine/serine/threonine protein phosphatase PPS1 [Rhodotorula paludigena]|uniref:tyrosine/serine/threonine protein phosphatase PPS1 n=1 Tax=Rhodotorula paludigena TaxID=86838 RepID=UPI003173B042